MRNDLLGVGNAGHSGHAERWETRSGRAQGRSSGLDSARGVDAGRRVRPGGAGRSPWSDQRPARTPLRWWRRRQRLVFSAALRGDTRPAGVQGSGRTAKVPRGRVGARSSTLRRRSRRLPAGRATVRSRRQVRTGGTAGRFGGRSAREAFRPWLTPGVRAAVLARLRRPCRIPPNPTPRRGGRAARAAAGQSG